MTEKFNIAGKSGIENQIKTTRALADRKEIACFCSGQFQDGEHIKITPLSGG